MLIREHRRKTAREPIEKVRLGDRKEKLFQERSAELQIPRYARNDKKERVVVKKA